jgi:hypothetical protein
VLAAGSEAPFVVAILDPGIAARFRVSFRASLDDRVVPHIDRRDNRGKS